MTGTRSEWRGRKAMAGLSPIGNVDRNFLVFVEPGVNLSMFDSYPALAWLCEMSDLIFSYNKNAAPKWLPVGVCPTCRPRDKRTGAEPFRKAPDSASWFIFLSLCSYNRLVTELKGQDITAVYDDMCRHIWYWLNPVSLSLETCFHFFLFCHMFFSYNSCLCLTRIS